MSNVHGSHANYTTGGCRCPECTDGHAAYVREISKQKAEGYASRATDSEVHLWAESLGFSFPRRPSTARVTAQRDLLIERYNREHPDRPYLRPSERGGAA